MTSCWDSFDIITGLLLKEHPGTLSKPQCTKMPQGKEFSEGSSASNWVVELAIFILETTFIAFWNPPGIVTGCSLGIPNL